MRRAKRRALGLFLAGLLATGGAQAGDAEDVSLTVAVRKALTREERLATLGLGVTVSDGRVTVWGPVPSAELAALVEARVKALAGVKDVTSEVHVLPRDTADADRKPVAKTAGPEPVVLSPLPGLPLPVLRVQRDEDRSPPAQPIKLDAARRTAAKEPAPEILAPAVARADPTLVRPIANQPAVGLAAHVEAILVRNARYDGVNAAVQSGLVRLSGTLEQWSDLWPLSDELSNLPGVTRVVVDKITIAR